MDPPGQQDDLPFDWLDTRKPEMEFAFILRWMAVGTTLFFGFGAAHAGPGPGRVVYAVIACGVLVGGVVIELIYRSRFRRSVTGLRVEGRELVARRVDGTLTRHPLDAVTSVLITDFVGSPQWFKLRITAGGEVLRTTDGGSAAQTARLAAALAEHGATVTTYTDDRDP
jgi:hypothetical protein